MTDPMEKLIADALYDANVYFVTERDPQNGTNLDFYLPDYGVLYRGQAVPL